MKDIAIYGYYESDPLQFHYLSTDPFIAENEFRELQESILDLDFIEGETEDEYTSRLELEWANLAHSHPEEPERTFGIIVIPGWDIYLSINRYAWW